MQGQGFPETVKSRQWKFVLFGLCRFILFALALLITSILIEVQAPAPMSGKYSFYNFRFQ
jgi:hypothetical protein